MTETTLFSIAENIVELRAAKVNAEIALSEASERLQRAEQDLVTRMISMDPPVTKFSQGDRTFSIATNRYASARAGMQPSIAEWLRDNGHDSLVKNTVHAQTLRGFVNEIIETDGALPEDLGALVNVYETQSIRVRNS